MRIPSGVTDQYIYFVAVDATDLKTRETGLTTFTVYRSRNGGVAAAFTTPTINETDATNMPGVYELLLDEDMTIDAGDDSQEVVFHITHTGMSPVTRTIELYRPKITAGETAGVSSGAVSTVAAVTTVNGLAAGVITAAAIAADAITATKVAADVSAEIASAVWDLDATAHQTAGTFGQTVGDSAGGNSIRTIVSNILTEVAAANQLIEADTAQAGAASTITLSASASATDNFYNNTLIFLTGGAGALQARFISSYVGATKVATVNGNWVTNPDVTTTYSIFAFGALPGASAPTAAEVADAVWDEAQAGHVGAGTFGEIATEIAAILVDTAEIGAAGAGLTALATQASVNTIDDFLDTEIAAILAAVDTEIAAIKAKTDNLPAAPAATGDIPTAAAVADAVWDEATLGHTTAGTFGEQAKTDIDAILAAVDTEIAAIITTLGTPAGASVSADIAAMKAETASIQSDTNDVQTRLPAALVSGRIDASVGAMAADVLTAAATAGDFGTEIATAVKAITVNELATVPIASPTLAQALAFIYMALRNKRDTTASADEIHNDAGTVIATAVLSDDGTTFTKGEYA